MDIRKIYQYALGREYEGKHFFEENAGRLSHAAAAGAFRRLAQEEQKHIEFIQAQLSALEEGDLQYASIGEQIDETSYFIDRARTELLDQTVLESMVPDLPVLRLAYLIERDFAEFYETYASKTEGEARQALEKLAFWERRHESLFKELHDKAFKEYAEMPWGG